VPKTIVKPIREIARAVEEYQGERNVKDPKAMTTAELRETIREVEKNMKEAAKQLDFERAAELRDVLFELRASMRA
jgi:excinuclease ABC subunit B